MKLPKNYRLSSGFTLIELLIVIGILAVLLSIVLIAINPTRQFQQARDTQRRNDVNAVLNAIYQYAADNNGSLPANLTTTALTMKSAGVQGTDKNDICASLVSLYLAAMPRDPSTGSYTNCLTYDSGYTVIKDATTNRVTVTATPEITEATISVTR